jgi:hypothetical protein
VLVNGHAPLNSRARRMAESTLGRLIRPLHDVYALRRVDASTRPQATRVMLGQMHHRRKSLLAVVGGGVVRRGRCDAGVVRGRQRAAAEA